jgi:general secretion pathway protein D
MLGCCTEVLTRSGVPFVGDIPVLGNLFSTTSDAFDRSELIVLLMPRVVRTSENMRGVTKDLKAAMRETFGSED